MRNIIIIAITLLLSYNAQSQWSLSGKTGTNISSVLTKNTTDIIDGVKAPYVGVNFEVLADYRLSNQFSIASGIGYTERGFSLDRRENIDILDIKVPVGLNLTQKVQTINIPLRLNYKIPVEQISLYAIAGGGYSYNLSSAIHTTGTAIGDFTINEFNTNGIVNKDEFYANLGAGASFKVGPGSVFGEVLYAKSFQNYTSDLFLDLPLRNQNITVGVGYSMPL